ncbi:MAG: flagellar export protein FliJ [Thermoguttaceae bacterium]
MAFRFQLDSLLSIRNSTLKEKQGALGKAYEARRIVEEKRFALAKDISDTLNSGREMIASGMISPDYLLGLRRHEAFLATQQQEVEQHLVLIDEEIERRLAAVVEANKELKMVEKLKEKRREKYVTEETRKEVVQMDEIAQRDKKFNF